MNTVHAEQISELSGIELITLVRVFTAPGIGWRVLDNDSRNQRGDDASDPWRKFPGLKVDVEITAKTGESCDEIGLTHRKRAVQFDAAVRLHSHLMEGG
jgi:hypothetical protein